MRKFIYILGLAVLAGLLFSCSGAKKVVQSEEITVPLIDEQERNQLEFEMLFVESLKQKMLGNVRSAAQLLARCLEIDPNSTAALYELANLYADNNNLNAALQLMEKAVLINPDNKWYKITLAQIYQQQRKFEQASDIYFQLLKNDPNNYEYLYMRAVLFANAGKTAEAIDAYDALEEKIGINEQISIEKQQLYTSMGDTEKAFAEIHKLIASDPSDTQYYGILADLYLEYGDEENALIYYNKILEMEPDNGFVHFTLANYYISKGDFDKVFDEVKLGLTSDDIDIQLKLQFFVMLISNGLETRVYGQKAEELAQVLIEKHPDEFLVYTVFAEVLMQNGKFADAREQLLKFVEIEPNDYAIWERIIYISNDLEDWDELYKSSEKAISLFPSQPISYLFNAVACIQLEKYDGAISIVDDGLDLATENRRLEGQFLMLKGEALYKSNRHDEAFELFDNVIELVPDNYVALNNYAYYLSLVEKDLDKAEKMSAKVIEQFPDNSTYLDTYAWVFFKKGEYKLARFYMQSALSNGGQDNPTLLEHYGDILYMLEMKDEAIQYWEKAKDNGSDSKVLDRKISEQKYINE